MNPKIIGSAPVLMVYDVVSTAHFYRDQLGFHFNKIWGEPPSFCILNRDSFMVMISMVPVDAELSPNSELTKDFWDIYFWTDDVRALSQGMEQKGVELYHPLTEKDYGVLEFEIKDNNGYILAFGQVLEK